MYCLRCSYRLTGLSALRCPECGLGFDPCVPTSFSDIPRCERTQRQARETACVLVVLTVIYIFVILMGVLFEAVLRGRFN